MTQILTTIIPIFVIIFLGWIARMKGMIPPEFLNPANRITYYLAIPAMIFRSISQGSLKKDFQPDVLLFTLGSLLLFFFFTWFFSRIAGIPKQQSGTFVQTSFHGNLGYIGLAVAYYFLGDQGLARAGILAGFLMVVQNFLAVSVLQFHAEGLSPDKRIREILLKIIANPVILSAMCGILFSLSGLPMPLLLGRSLDILRGLALPLSLLLIGASLSFAQLRSRKYLLSVSAVMKLLLLPGLGFALYRLWGISPADFIPGLILLASPTATISYVMAKEMRGDADFAVAAISLTTLLSSFSLTFWLNAAF